MLGLGVLTAARVLQTPITSEQRGASVTIGAPPDGRYRHKTIREGGEGHELKLLGGSGSCCLSTGDADGTSGVTSRPGENTGVSFVFRPG